jgi:predicted transcriptional regulator
MAPKEWRESEGLKLGDVAALLKRSRMSVWHYETGRRDTPNSVVLTYGRISKGKVTPRDMHAVRQAWLRSKPRKAA